MLADLFWCYWLLVELVLFLFCFRFGLVWWRLVLLLGLLYVLIYDCFGVWLLLVIVADFVIILFVFVGLLLWFLVLLLWVGGRVCLGDGLVCFGIVLLCLCFVCCGLFCFVLLICVCL